MTCREGVLSSRPGGPRVAPVKCSGCGLQTDPLRTAHVAIFGNRFHYFCHILCRERFLAQLPDSPLPTAHTNGASAPCNTLIERPAQADPAYPTSDIDREDGIFDDAFAEDVVLPHVDEFVALDDQGSTPRSDPGAVLLVSATVAGVLAIALALTGTGSLALTIRLAISCVGVVLLVVRSWLVPTDPADPHPIALIGPVVATAAIAVWARVVGHGIADESAVLAGLIVVSTATSMHLVERSRHSCVAWLAAMRQALDVPARRVVPSGYSIVTSSSVRPGEEILIDAGETVPADVVISAGEATVLPWLGARSATAKRPGDSLVAGSRVVTGRLRTTATWTGFDRAWMCATLDRHRAAHVMVPVARHAREIVERWALGAAVLAGLAAFYNGLSTPHVALATIVGHAAVASAATAAAPSVHILKGVISALRQGVSYRNAAAWEHAALATIAVFSARGTLLLGEPHVAEIVPLGDVSTARLLEVASGAETVARDAIAASVRRAARDRGVIADAVRSRSIIPGLGVTAVTSTGEALCVGSRALMMREHISMASVEERLAELETMGRTVLLVSVSGKLIGFIALQDGLRHGARAAVQYLLDDGIEPVLMSGDARETCEAVARSLDIEHVRPEIVPSDRAHEVKAMAESGAAVAVIGRLGDDDAALGAADVAVALNAAGSSSGDWSVTLAGDDVRDAASALVIARRARLHARVTLVLGLAPGVASALTIAFGILPPAYAPLAVLISAVATHLHLRAVTSSQHDGNVP